MNPDAATEMEFMFVQIVTVLKHCYDIIWAVLSDE